MAEGEDVPGLDRCGRGVRRHSGRLRCPSARLSPAKCATWPMCPMRSDFNMHLMEDKVDTKLGGSEGRWDALNVTRAEKDQADRPVGSMLGRRAQAWRQKTANLILVLSDVVLALAVWEAAILIRDAWSIGPVSGVTVAGVLPGVAVWVVLRAFLGLYPGYGLNAVDDLRRQTYATLGTLTITATFAVVLQVGDAMSRFVLAAGFLALSLFAPLARQFMKWWLMRAGLWGKPVVVFSSGAPGDRVAALLSREWGLGYKSRSPCSAATRGRTEGTTRPHLTSRAWRTRRSWPGGSEWTPSSSRCRTPAGSIWQSWSTGRASPSGTLR